jgi:cytoskeleton-associated protein 5
VEKGLAATRPAAKQKALEALMLLIELDKAEPVIEELLPMLSHKQPKIIAATLSALTSIYHAFGVRTVEPKPVLKALPKLFSHADKNVRAESQNLCCEFYRWLKEAMKPLFWNDLKPIQQQDLDKLFEKVKDEPAPKQERLLRSQQAIVEAAPVRVAVEEEEYEEEAAIDLEPEHMAVNVQAAIPTDFGDRLASSKWKDRKEVLEELHKAINYPAIEEGNFNEYMNGFAKSMKDANIAVVTIAANCVEAFAIGLGKNFVKYRSTVMGPMMERLKEKKQAVTDAIAAALDAIFKAVKLSDCLEETLEFLKHKNPQVKLHSTLFLVRCLKSTREAPQIPEVKSIAEAATKLLTESQETQRSAGAEVLGTLWKIMGDRLMMMHLEGLDEIRKTKIKEFMEAAEVKAKYKPKAAAPPPKAAAAAPIQKKMFGQKKANAAAAATKRPAPRAAPPPPQEEPVAPLAPQPNSRVGVSRMAPPKSGLAPPGGLRAPKKTSGIAAPSGAAASPRRAVVSPPLEEAAPPPQPKIGLAGRGLAGRPLGKPAPPPAEYAAPSPQNNGLGAVERAELEELRSEVDHLRRQHENWQSDRTKLQSQIYELQNQNAQLIEDHTRDVLSIKAKETQLVRARSDYESAEQTVQNQQREMDRLKRELSRQVRVSSPAPPDYSDQIYAETGVNGGAPPGGRYGDSGYSSTGYGRHRAAVAPQSPSDEGKENLDADYAAPRDVKPSPRVSRERPTQSTTARSSNSSRLGSGAAGRMSPPDTIGSAASGAESWKRAAEVTQNLKARIELMKVR